MRSARARGIRGHAGSRRWLDATVAVAAVLVTALSGGCVAGGRGAKPEGETKAPPPDAPAALRQEVDRLRGDLAEMRTRLEASQRAGTEHADRVAQETRAEFEAVQKAVAASSRHDLQRQVEVLDAQARRIDLLEKRAAELGQVLRRVELSLAGMESQLARVLDPVSPGARGGSPARSPAPRPPEESTPPASAADSGAAGAGLTPPAMLGAARTPRSAPPAPPTLAPARENKVDPGEGPRTADAPPAMKKTESPSPTPPAVKKMETPNPTPPAVKKTEAPGAAPAARPASEDPARVAKAVPPPVEPKAAAPERPASGASPRPAKTGTTAAAPVPGPGSPTARALFDRAMESWNKGEQGQAVLEFEELVQTFPGDPLAAPAQFRIGEAYYAARDYERASLEYRKAVDLAPKGKDTPQALLRLGLAYRAQKRESDARQAWNQLVRDFPESDATEEARRALRGR